MDLGIYIYLIVKNCEQYETSPSLEAIMLASQLPEFWWKTWDTWVRDKGQYVTATAVARILAFFALVLQAPIPINNMKRATVSYITGERSEVRELRSFISAVGMPALCSRWKHCLYYIGRLAYLRLLQRRHQLPRLEANLPFAPEEDTVSSKSARCINLLFIKCFFCMYWGVLLL